MKSLRSLIFLALLPFSLNLYAGSESALSDELTGSDSDLELVADDNNKLNTSSDLEILLTENTEKKLHKVLKRLSLGQESVDLAKSISDLKELINLRPRGKNVSSYYELSRTIWASARLLVYASKRSDIMIFDSICERIVNELIILFYEDPNILFIDDSKAGTESALNKAKLQVKMQAAQALAEIALIRPQLFRNDNIQESLARLIQLYSKDMGNYLRVREHVYGNLQAALIFSMNKAQALEYYSKAMGQGSIEQNYVSYTGLLHAIWTQIKAQSCLKGKVSTVLDAVFADFQVTPVVPLLREIGNLARLRDMDAPFLGGVSSMYDTVDSNMVKGGLTFLTRPGDLNKTLFEIVDGEKYFTNLREHYGLFRGLGLPGQEINLDLNKVTREFEQRIGRRRGR